jgi:hypothetical protein
MLAQEDIIKHVKKAINPKFKDWVLFSNGTYIIFEDSATGNKKEKAIELMKEYGPLEVGSPAGDFSVTTLHFTDGWVVSGHCYGMYTYVHPSEFESQEIKKPNDVDIGIFGRNKRDKDGREHNIIFVSDNNVN